MYPCATSIVDHRRQFVVAFASSPHLVVAAILSMDGISWRNEYSLAHNTHMQCIRNSIAFNKIACKSSLLCFSMHDFLFCFLLNITLMPIYYPSTRSVDTQYWESFRSGNKWKTNVLFQYKINFEHCVSSFVPLLR